MRTVKIMKTNPNALIPTKGSAEAAGYDLYSMESVSIKPGETVMIDTGIAIELPSGTFGGIYARSGLASKKGLRPANCVGVVDSDYRGSIKVALHNDSNITQGIDAKERIAQLIIQPYIISEMYVVTELSNTDRGAGGFGSSGTK